MEYSVKFCSPDKKASRSCIGLRLTMKCGYISRILNVRNRCLIPANHQHLPQDQIATDGRRCCVFGGISRVLRSLKTWWNCPTNATLLCVKKSLSHTAYWPDLARSDYHLFSSMGSPSGTSILTKLSENGLMSGFPRTKEMEFFGVVSTNCPTDGKNL